jgi:hypothetical protein
MRFQTIWQKPVLDQLADVWLHAPDRNAVTVATTRIEQLLWKPTRSILANRDLRRTESSSSTLLLFTKQ